MDCPQSSLIGKRRGVYYTYNMLRLSLLCLTLTATATLCQADMLKSVDSAQQSEIAAGQVVVQSENVEGAPWPKLTLFQIVNASPKVVWNLLTDLSAAPTYTPNLVSAKVLQTNPDGSKNVEFTTKVPILGKINYTVRNTYKSKPGGTSEVSWTLIQSPLAKTSDGSLAVEPYGNGQSLLRYVNFVVPVTNLVAGLKGQALSEARTTMQAIKTEAEKRAAGGQ